MQHSLFAGFEEILLGEFIPHLAYHPELSLLIYLTEDCSYVSVRISNAMSFYRHGYEDRLVGVEFWIPYHPQRLLS